MKENHENQENQKDSAQWQKMEKLLLELAQDQNPSRLKILASFFKVAAKIGADKYGTLNLKIATNALRELRYSFKLFYPYRHIPKITMFGSARVPRGTPLYDFAKQFAETAAKRNFMIITGGGPGIMAAGNEGATSESGFGLNIRLPMEQSANTFIDQEKKLIHYKYFFTRKLFLVKEAIAFAFFPGGFGTFDEAFEVLTLLQTGKTNMIPIVMMEPKGYGFWAPAVKFLNTVLGGKGFISKEDSSLYKVCHDVDEGLDHIEKFYSNYHSMRLVGENLVIRLKKGMSEKSLAECNKEFSALAGGKKMILGGELPEEHNEPELKHLTRLIFPFDRTNYGRLRQLVDFINESAL